MGLLVLSGCASSLTPGERSVDIPPPVETRDRLEAVNENYQPVTYLTLADDVLVPKALNNDPLPDIYVGPYELRSETLAGALQLILADFDISMAFQSEEGLTRRITVANLSGRLPEVVRRVCGLADLYCGYKDGLLTIKELETFVVDLPPIGDDGAQDSIITGLTNILSTNGQAPAQTPIIDETTGVVVYQASSRTAKSAEDYFDRLRKNTALIVFETNVWQVTLNNENRTGINWTAMLQNLGNFDFDISIPGGAPAGSASPISITPTFNGSSDLTSSAVLDFISEYGAVKTISQPQLTVLSGSEATLSVANSNAFVSEVTRTVDENGDETFSIATDTVETGLVLTIGSGWDDSTVYGDIDISLDELLEITSFVSGDGTTVQLPNTSTQSLQTQVRVRPGDGVLVAGLVSESDAQSESGPGFLKPLFSTARSVTTDTSELVFLLRPRVVVYETKAERDIRLKNSTDVSDIKTAPLTADVLDALAPVAISSSVEQEHVDAP